MKGIQRAARHGSYATQFWTRPNHPPHQTRRAMLRAHSKKVIQRRLVLPLDAHNWSRALEVLDARYAKLGRTAEDYQRVIRGIADEVTPQGRRDALHTLNALRDRVYMGEIGSRGLWVTLLWAYVRLRYPREGYETLLQAERRVLLSALTKQHMGDVLLPLLAAHGMVDEAKYVVENFMNVNGSRLERVRVSSLVAEAAARSGSWERAVASLQPELTSTSSSDGRAMKVDAQTPTSLFVSWEKIDSGRNALTSSSSSSNTLGSVQQQLSTKALRCMMCSMADDGQWMLAIKCLQELRRRSRRCSNDSSPLTSTITSTTTTSNNNNNNNEDAVRRRENLQKDEKVVLSENELQRLLNALGSQQRWKEAVILFGSHYFMGEEEVGAKENHQTDRRNIQERLLHETTLNLLFSSFPRDKKEYRLIPPDDNKSESRYFHAHRQNAGEKETERGVPTVELDVPHQPQQVVSVLDRLLEERDDVAVTDWVMAAVGPSLLQLGQWDRALHLMRQAPLFTAVKPPACMHEAERHVQRQLVALLYYIHGAISLESRYYTLYHFPLLFPKELFRGLPLPSELKAHLEREQEKDAEKRKKDKEEEKKNAVSASSSCILKNDRETCRFASRRKSAVVQHTEKHDDELKRRLSLLYSNSASAFRGDDPDKDPRPQPKGLHDTANGWNFYGRGGEMVFANHRRTAHPFSMHPKLMRSLNNPYRGWNPRQNSSLAHRERVKKWNGRSSV